MNKLQPDLKTEIAGIKMRNPLLTASGTFGYGKDYTDLIPMDTFGAITVKGVSPFQSDGNPVPRTAEVFGGMLNAIGLQNPGIDKFIEDSDYLPFLQTVDTNVFINIWGKTLDDYVCVAETLDKYSNDIAALEINISCPNIKEGGISFGTDLKQTHKIVSSVRQATSLPLITKLSPNVSNIAEFAKCSEEAGSDMISLINTLPAMAIDIETHRPKLANITGGLSGPAIKPVAIKMVYDAAQAVKIPVIGMGGIVEPEDAIEFLIAGADAIAIGTALFYDSTAPKRILDGIRSYMKKNGIANIKDLVGTVSI
ncbi:MAG: dihydroorotate dehydrogenase [Verrucomicrobiota bacterium]|nr:dihydroorotate dehydrogenase [Verrucomicrobiota bacterium]